jgi:hypothetical protein
LKITTEHAPVLLDQAAQPLADRLVTRVTSEEDSGEPLEFRQSVPKLVLPRQAACIRSRLDCCGEARFGVPGVDTESSVDPKAGELLFTS